MVDRGVQYPSTDADLIRESGVNPEQFPLLYALSQLPENHCHCPVCMGMGRLQEGSKSEDLPLSVLYLSFRDKSCRQKSIIDFDKFPDGFKVVFNL